MSRATRIVRGNASNIFSSTIDNNVLYDVLDKPVGGITNSQMEFALSHTGFVKLGSVYQCTDSGTYTQKHLYQFTSNGWVDTTLITDLSNVLTKLSGTDADKLPIIDNQGQIYASDNYFTIFNSGDPTTATVGKVNQLYVNTTANTIFRCSSVNAQGTTPETYTYTWISVSGGGGSGGSGVTEITDSSIRITDLAAGIYKTTQTSTTINYNGTSGTGSVSAGKGSILTVSTDGSTKWSWELINTSSSNASSVVYYGYTGTSSGSYTAFTRSQLESLRTNLSYYITNTNATNYIYNLSKGLHYLTNCTRLYYTNTNYYTLSGYSLLYLYNITTSTSGTVTTTNYFWVLLGNVNQSSPTIASGITIKRVDSSTSPATTTYSYNNSAYLPMTNIQTALNNYNKVLQVHDTSTSLYPLLARPTIRTSTANYTSNAIFNQNVYIQPSTGTIYATDFNINGTDISTYVDNKISAAIGSASQLLGNTGDL